MAHDGNTQRDTVPRLSEPADGGRSTEAESPKNSAGSSDQPGRFQASPKSCRHSTWSLGRAAQKRARLRTSRCRRWQPASALQQRRKPRRNLRPPPPPRTAACQGRRSATCCQAPAGCAAACAHRRQRRCAIDRRPHLFVAAEAFQPSVHGGSCRLRRMARGGRPACLGHAVTRDRAHQLSGSAGQPVHDHRGGHDFPAHRAVLVPGHAGVARTRTQAHVLGHDRGRRSPRRAGPGGGTIGGVSRTGRAPPGLVHERSHLARARTRRRAGGAGPQRSGIAGEILRRKRAQDPGADPGTGR